MGTRATYRFIGDRHNPTTTIYNHWDGYPEGAACKIYDALSHPLRGRGLAAAFLRANDDAEITQSHEAHGDTEYRYDVTCPPNEDTQVKAIERVDFTDEWKVIFSGSVYEFCNKYASKVYGPSDEDYLPFVKVNGQHSRTWTTEAIERRRLADDGIRAMNPLATLRQWFKGDLDSSYNLGNWHSQCEQLRGIVEAFPNLMTIEIAAILDHDARKYAESRTELAH